MNYDDELERAKIRKSRSRQASQQRTTQPGTTKESSGYQRQTEEKNIPGQLDASMGQRRRDTASFGERPRTSSAPRQSRQRMERKKKRRVWIILAEVFLLIGILTFAAYSFVKQKMDLIQRLPFDTSNIENMDLSSEKKEQMKGYWTIAVFGVDDRGKIIGKGTNADVNMICNINRDTGEIRMVSVFRDTYLNISDKNSYNKINQAYFLGGPEQAVKALNKNLDLNIKNYATFNWKAVAEGINILGGIDLEISKAEFYYINAFITETVKATGIYSEHLTKPGMQHLDGVQAVAYGRLRLMDTDFARTERQRKVITLAFEKAKSADWAVLNNIIETVFPNVATNIELTDAIDLAWDIGKYHIGESGGFPFARGDARMGSKGACVIPQTLESNVIQLHQFLFDDETYITTDTVKTISNKISSDSGMYKEGKNAGKVDTDGGYVPKETKATEETSKKSTEAEESTEESDASESLESSTAPENTMRPGGGASGWEEWETDANGNYIDPAWQSTRPGTRPTNPSESTGQRPGTGQTTAPHGTMAPGNAATTSPTSAPTTAYPGTPGSGPGTSPTQSTTSPGAPTTAPAPSAPSTSPPANRPGGGTTTPTTGAVTPGGPSDNQYPGAPTTAPPNQGDVSFQGPGGR